MVARCPAFDALHKRRMCQEPDLDFFPKRMPAEGTTAAFDFCRNRRVPLAAQQSELSKFSAEVKVRQCRILAQSGRHDRLEPRPLSGVPFLTQAGHERCCAPSHLASQYHHRRGMGRA